VIQSSAAPALPRCTAVHRSIAEREHDSRAHISPQRQFADWIIQYSPRTPIGADGAGATAIPLRVRHIVWNDAPIAGICDRLSQLPGFQINFVTDPEDIDRMTVDMDGEPTADQIQKVADELFPIMRHITRTSSRPRFRAGLQGVSQLMSLALLRAKHRYDDARLAEDVSAV
jgi:hypothetical protein